MAKAEEVLQSNQNQIVSINDQYIAKRRKQRIIINSIILSFAIILGIAVILMSCLRIDLKPRFDDTPKYVNIVVDEENKELFISKNDKLYDEFFNIYNNSLCTTILTSLFTGNFYGYEIEYLDSGVNDPAKYYDSEGKLSSILLNRLGSNYVQFRFSENQTLYRSNGEKYTARYSKNYNNEEEVYYKDVCFTISSDENSTVVDFYFGVVDYISEPTLVKISIEANSYDLYKFACEN